MLQDRVLEQIYWRVLESRKDETTKNIITLATICKAPD